jgi:septal ring factor EnvC (AmiA/AmiB activator)
VGDERHRTDAPDGAGTGQGAGGRGGRRRAGDMASWALVAAMVVLGAGAAGYVYLQHRAAVTNARIHMRGAHRHHGGGQAGAVRPQRGEAASYYPPVGTPARPVAGDVVEPFGWQYEKAIGLYRDVPGWALAAHEGEPVRAVIGGRVVANFLDPTEGREVVVTSANGDSLIYGDLASPGPAIGTRVRAGSVFAHVGPAGKLSGVAAPHLFLEVTVAGQPRSPSMLLGDVPGAQSAGQATAAGAAAAAKA